MVEVKASVLPHVLGVWLRLSKGVIHVKYLLLRFLNFVAVTFYDLTGLSQSCGESDYVQLLGIIPDLRHLSLSMCN